MAERMRGVADAFGRAAVPVTFGARVSTHAGT